MAIIGKIREKQGLIITVVGVALILFVIPVDKIWSSITGQGVEQPIGEIYEEPIYDSEWNYEKKVDQQIINYKNQLYQAGMETTVSDEITEQIKHQTWQEMVVDTLLYMELEKIGIDVCDKELNEGLLNYADPIPSYLTEQDQFKDGFGEFSVDSFATIMGKYISNRMQTAEGKRELKIGLEDQLKTDRTRKKYQKMVQYGMVATTKDAHRNFIEENSKANIKYVFANYSTIPDEEISVSDKELKKYYNDHRYEKKWKQQTDLRSFKYVVFSIEPSEKDNSEALADMERLKSGFANAVNDSMFVVHNAATPIVKQTQYGEVPSGNWGMEPFIAKGTEYPAEVLTQLETASAGDVIGPFIQLRQVKLMKVREVVEVPEAYVRHILVNAAAGLEEGEMAAKKATADSISNALQRDSSLFATLADKYNEDPGHATNSGYYTWFGKGKMVPEFEDFSFNGAVGGIKVVKTTYGFHIVQVMGQRSQKAPLLATIDAIVTPSKPTKDQLYADLALPFYEACKKSGIDKAAEKAKEENPTLGIIPVENVRLDYPSMGALGKNLNVLKWAFNNEKGSVMEPEYISEEQLIVCALTSVTHEGDPEFSGTAELMRPEVIKEKKVAMLKKQVASLRGIDAIAQELGQTTQNAEVALSYNNIANDENKPQEGALIGEIFGMSTGTVSAPIAGKDGMYIVVVENKTVAASPTDLSVNKGIVTGELRAEVETRLVGALFEHAKVKDWRMKRTVMQNN